MPQLDHYLTRVHRRWTLLRATERIALCILIASVVAMILSAILIARGESAMLLVAICIGIGVGCGTIVGVMMRPTLFDTAVEVDRQLELADLLATALAVRRAQTVIADSLDDQWSQTILSLAEVRCASIANEPLMLRRFGVRAWSGVGVCLTIAIALGAMSMNPLILQAKSGSAETIPELQQTPGDAAVAISDRTAQLPSDQTPESSAASKIDVAAEKNDDASASRASDARTSAGASGDQTGAGAGRTNEPDRIATQRDGISDGASSATGDLTSGGGRSASESPAGATTSTTSGATASRSQAPPWDSADWQQSQRRANDEIRANQIPDAYRDLVRDYFER